MSIVMNHLDLWSGEHMDGVPNNKSPDCERTRGGGELPQKQSPVWHHCGDSEPKITQI